MMVEAELSTHGDAEEENYFISMTDMMVGVLFIFIIMLMTFALNFQKQADRQEDKIVVAEEVGRKLDVLERRVSERLIEIRESASARAQLLHDLRVSNSIGTGPRIGFQSGPLPETGGTPLINPAKRVGERSRADQGSSRRDVCAGLRRGS